METYNDELEFLRREVQRLQAMEQRAKEFRSNFERHLSATYWQNHPFLGIKDLDFILEGEALA